MKNIFKTLSVLAAGVLLATSCVDETFPESSTATAEQVGASASALQGALNGIPSQMSQWYYVYGNQTHETDMAYLMFPIADTELLGDMFPGGSETGYDWFRSYNVSTGFGLNSYPAYLSWFSCYKLVKAANDVIAVVDLDNANDEMKSYAAQAYTSRALFYYQLMVHWEFAENIYTQPENDVVLTDTLTVPIVTEKTTGEESKNNPRATRSAMISFILSDLDIAEANMVKAPASKNLPSLACVYGMKARVYMWNEDYKNALVYARKAIEANGGSPVTEQQWHDVNTGFNTENQAWMWKCSYDAENMANLCNWTGWMSNEADWGYSSLTQIVMDKSLYDHINYTDFRKYSYLDPDRSVYDYKTCREEGWLDEQPDYFSLKFRCVNGDFETYTIGGVCDVPIMRVEEFYFIEAEALARTEGLAAGLAALNNFMQTYRDPSYSCTSKDVESLAKEILAQMRIEFWGEGTAFATAKRQRAGVMQWYEGSNAPADIYKLNCQGVKPNWNYVIPQYEIDNNPVLGKQNNPDPSSVIKTPCTAGEYAPANN